MEKLVYSRLINFIKKMNLLFAKPYLGIVDKNKR